MLVPKPRSKLGRADPVAFQAEGSKVRKIAFTAAFSHGDDVICIPNRFAASKLPILQCAASGSASQFAQAGELGDTIHSTDGADASVALQYSLAKMARIRAEPPLLHAPVGTERPTSLWHFQVAPTADTPAVFTFGNRVAAYAAPRHCALGAHRASRRSLWNGCELVIDGNSKASGQGVCLVS